MTTQRNFIARGLAVGTAIALGKRASVLREKIGHVKAGEELDRTHRVRVWLNGEEVSQYCSQANDVEGWAMVYPLLSRDPLVLDLKSGGPWKTWGDVRITAEKER